MKGTAFGNALIADMEKQGNQYLVEKVLIDQTVVISDMICMNMLLIWKLIGIVTFKKLNKAYIIFG